MTGHLHVGRLLLKAKHKGLKIKGEENDIRGRIFIRVTVYLVSPHVCACLPFKVQASNILSHTSFILGFY